MERRDFLNVAVGFAAGAAASAVSAQAAPLVPPSPNAVPLANENAHPAVTSSEEASRLTPEEVRWGHGHHGGWHHRHWGGHHRHWGWHRRHWGWHRRHWGWHRHHWHRHWRR
jgi:hypothetical protein